MPQFELTFYVSQAFWMVVSFGFLYLMMAYLVCPMLEDVFGERERLIQQDLDKADVLRRQADDLMQRQHMFEIRTEEEKNKRIQDAFVAMRRKAAAKEARNERSLQQRVRKTEEKMAVLAAEVTQKADVAAEHIADELATHFFREKEAL